MCAVAVRYAIPTTSNTPTAPPLNMRYRRSRNYLRSLIIVPCSRYRPSPKLADATSISLEIFFKYIVRYMPRQHTTDSNKGRRMRADKDCSPIIFQAIFIYRLSLYGCAGSIFSVGMCNDAF